MGFFKNMFGDKTGQAKEEKQLPWQNLQRIDQISAIAERSKTKTQLIFKHSKRCGISRMVLRQFVDLYDVDSDADLYYLDLLSYREVSDEVGYTFQVLHQSPQLLVIKNGVAIAHASHGSINDMALQRYL